MNKRVLLAAGAVVVLGGGSLAFVLWRAASERAAQVEQLVAAVASELAVDQPDLDDLRTLLRQVRTAAETDPRAEFALAEAELLVALGRAKEAWSRIEILATAPGAVDQTITVGARVAAAAHAATGVDSIGRQALALADDSARRGGDRDAAFLAWQMALRIGDADAFVARTNAAFGTDAEGVGARTIRATARVLGELLATRLGFDLGGMGGVAAAGPLKEVLAKAPKTERRSLEELLADWKLAPPELEIAVAATVFDELGAVGVNASDLSEVERLLRVVVSRAESALAALPSSSDARSVTVIAYAGLRQTVGLGADDVTRLRGHLRWLFENASPAHAARPVWVALQEALGS